jgi:uncharacterized protein YggU (UPF0235/DUF167 family)
MKIFITTKTRAKKYSVQQVDQTNFIVAVKEAPLDNKANDAVVRVLAEYFKISPSQVEIASGHTARKKIVELYL